MANASMLKNPRIVVGYPVESRHLEWLSAAWPEADVEFVPQADLSRELVDADIFVGHAKVPVDWESVVAAGRLQFIQSSAAGLDHCLVPCVVDSPITVCSASGLFANQVAEQTLALLLGVLRRLPTFFRQTLTKEYVRQPTDDLHGKRIGLVGLGGNGRRLVQVLKPFDTHIRAVDYFPDRCPPEVDTLEPPEFLLKMAAQSDILIATLPLNTATDRVINADVFNAMPAGGYFINVARGRVVDEPALIESLRNGQLQAAGIDVAAVEPLPAESPLWGLPNVIITPHVGAQAGRRVDDTTRLIHRNLAAYRAGQPLLNEVDKHLGFPHPSRQAVEANDWQNLFT